MGTKLIIVADLGLLRAYRVVQRVTDRQPHLELMDELRPESAHKKLSEQVTDKAGRFPRGSGSANVPGDLSAGERHNLELEERRRLIRMLTDRIDTLLTADSVVGCSLAASAPIHLELLQALAPRTRTKVEKTLALDLANTDPAELLGHFERGG